MSKFQIGLMQSLRDSRRTCVVVPDHSVLIKRPHVTADANQSSTSA